MNTLYHWKAKRSSATMTIKGIDQHGETTKLRFVVCIEADMPHPIATTADGDRWRLSLLPYVDQTRAADTPIAD